MMRTPPESKSGFVNVRNVLTRNPLLLSVASVAVVAVLLIGESSYLQSANLLETLNGLKDGTSNVHQLRSKLADGQLDIHRTLLLNRVGVAALSIACLVALFMYLRQSLALEEQDQRDKRELRHVVQVERQRLEVEVAERTAQLVQLTHHIETAREQERARLARDLHDEMGALLTSAKLDAARIKPRLVGIAPEALEQLAHLVSMLNSGIALKRSIIENLRPSTLSTLGLTATLEILARDLAKGSGIDVHSDLATVRLEEAGELVIYRVVQEAFNNVTKYAKASNLWLALAAHGGAAEVSVRDDGIGFDTKAASKSAYGLLGMRFRVEAEGGTLVVRSSAGVGTSILVRLPERALDGIVLPQVL